jgi:hypothetical protein
MKCNKNKANQASKATQAIKATQASKTTKHTKYIRHRFQGRQAIISLVLRWIMSKPK